ncbi:MAG: succinyl-CoA synthetase subunit beta [Deltaproteobacteria bacterium]|nr:MAG: succinyl-CoA synthetase subunit beta [Deltaproteobacteria bacterium]
MARLYEYQGKQLLKEARIPVPEGDVATTEKEVKEIAGKIGKPVAVKAQIWAGGRGKAGAIRFAETPEEAGKVAKELLGTKVKGFEVKRVLVEEKLDVEKEYYVGVIVDPSMDVRAPVVIFSTEGGVEIEEVPEDKIAKVVVDIFLGLRPFQALNLARKAGVPRKLLSSVAGIISALYQVFRKYSCRTIEINPLVVTADGRVIAADCRAAVDDSSVFRHPELGIKVARESSQEPTEFDEIAWSIEEGDLRGTGYVAQMTQEIEGIATVGYHGIGGGGAILGVDALNRAGLRVADYADTSGNPTAAKVYRVAKLILSQPNIEGYCLGGFIMANQEQWHHAHGIVKALREELPHRPGFPVVILLCGNKEKESLEILHEGLKGLPGRIEIYGSEHVYDTDFIAQRMRALVEEYKKERGAQGG